jgi:hypothetical protein
MERMMRSRMWAGSKKVKSGLRRRSVVRCRLKARDDRARKREERMKSSSLAVRSRSRLSRLWGRI